MVSKFRKQVIICPSRKREVEVTYTISGSGCTSAYKIVACPAMYDGDVACDRRCQAQLARPSRQENFVSHRV